MKKQTFFKQKQLKSQKSIDHAINNSFNFNEYPYNREKKELKKNISLRNIEDYKIKINNNTNETIKQKIYDNNLKIKKKGKLGELNYEIEPKNILLIPDNFNININNQIYEKELLPKQKTYFITEKNFLLIKETLNEKEEIINELNNLIEKYKNQKNNNISSINNNNDLKEKIFILEEENKKLEKENNDLIFQIEKKDIYFNKIYQLLKFVSNYYKNFKNNSDIWNFIKEQELEILFDNNELNNNKYNQNIYKNDDLIEILFKTNKDIIMNELEKYKKKYNDIRKQLSYITNLKFNDKDNENDNNKMILEYQKKINDLYFSNQNYIKENAYLKLICQNIFLEKKINNLKDYDYYNYNNINNKDKNIDINLIKEIDFLKKDKESLLQMINQIKTDLKNNKEENEIKIKQMSLNFELAKNEKVNIEKILMENNLKENKQNKKEINLINEEIQNLKNKNNLLYNKNNEIKSSFTNLIFINVIKLFIKGKNNIKNINNFEQNNNNDLFNKYLINNEIQNEKNNDNNILEKNDIKNKYKDNNYDINIKNLDLLMILYNKSKQLEQNLNYSLDS